MVNCKWRDALSAYVAIACCALWQTTFKHRNDYFDCCQMPPAFYIFLYNDAETHRAQTWAIFEFSPLNASIWRAVPLFVLSNAIHFFFLFSLFYSWISMNYLARILSPHLYNACSSLTHEKKCMQFFISHCLRCWARIYLTFWAILLERTLHSLSLICFVHLGLDRSLNVP